MKRKSNGWQVLTVSNSVDSLTIQTDLLRWARESPGCWIKRQEFSNLPKWPLWLLVGKQLFVLLTGEFLGPDGPAWIYTYFKQSCGFASFLNSTDY